MNQHMESFVRVAPLRNQRKGPEDPARPGGPVLVTLQSVKLQTSLSKKISAASNGRAHWEREIESWMREEKKNKENQTGKILL